jgi:hypothetical protein
MFDRAPTQLFKRLLKEFLNSKFASIGQEKPFFFWSDSPISSALLLRFYKAANTESVRTLIHLNWDSSNSDKSINWCTTKLNPDVFTSAVENFMRDAFRLNIGWITLSHLLALLWEYCSRVSLHNIQLIVESVSQIAIITEIEHFITSCESS